MREAAVPGYRLSKARSSTKVLITLALVGTTLGLLSAAALAILKTGIDPKSVAEYYLGSDTLADDLNSLLGSRERPLAELAEITHLHLVGGSLMLFLLCHLLALCDISDKLRTTIYLIAFFSFLLTFGSPWLIVFVSPACAWIFTVAVIVLIPTLLLASAIPVYEMWRK